MAVELVGKGVCTTGFFVGAIGFSVGLAVGLKVSCVAIGVGFSVGLRLVGLRVA